MTIATDPAARLRVAKLYAQKKLQDEVAENPRGYQAKLERSLHISSAHIANIVSGKSLPGEEMMVKLAKHWGTTFDTLVSIANGEKPKPVTTTIRDERYSVMDLVREAAKNDGFDAEFVDAFIADLDKDDQPSFGEIWGLLSSAYARHERKTRELGNPGADLDEPPPRTPRAQTARKKR